MSEKVLLKTLRCPTCGGVLKAENNTDAIVCVYCGNTIVPVHESNTLPTNESANGMSGSLRIDGIKNSSSALAYLELFFEEYDWNAFALAQTLSISEIDKLAESLKVTSADDKNTWFVCFNAISVPYLKKFEGCKSLLDALIEEYKRENLDAYSKFDAYKRISKMISSSKDDIEFELEKIIVNAKKYGATPIETDKLNADLVHIKNIPALHVYRDIECIPEIKSFIAEKNKQIEAKLASLGVDVESDYIRAKSLIEENKYSEALDVLLALNGYKDVNAMIEEIDCYFLISDVLKIEDRLYYFKKSDSTFDCLNLYSTSEAKISKQALITDIKTIITNFADIIYYVDKDNHIKKYNLSSQSIGRVFDKYVNEKSIFAYNRKVFFLAKSNDNDYSNNPKSIYELNLSTGSINKLVDDVGAIISLTGNKMIYTISQTISTSSDYIYDNTTITLTNIINVDTMEILELGTKKVIVEGFINNNVIYTQESPNKQNKNIYIKAFDKETPEVLIEQNILDFCEIIGGKIFYYIGNSKSQSLINVNFDGSERKEWPLHISSLLFEQGGWLYFVKKAGYNSILCKSLLDGSKLSIIATDIEKLIEFKNGYLYYINGIATLVKVRMDGSNLQELCNDVEEVLSVQDDKIIFVSVDDTVKLIKSLYAVDFLGSGKTKLAYNIKMAKKYDDNTVYYISAKEIKDSDSEQQNDMEYLYKLDVATNNATPLLEIKFDEKKSGCYIATCVYGSYDCPQVWTLRRFRDDTLGATWYGRLFIRTYYAISPTLVKWFGETSWFKRMWQGMLDRMVKKLNDNGVEDTKYQDKEW